MLEGVREGRSRSTAIYGLAFILLLVLSILTFIFVTDYTLGLAVFIALIIVTAIFVKPIIGVYLILFTMPIMNIGFTYQNPLRPANDFIHIVGFFILVAFLVYLLRKGVLERDNKPHEDILYLQHLCLMIITFYGVISLIWTLDFIHGVNMLYNLLTSMMALVVIPAFIESKEDLEGLLKFLSVFAIFIAAFAIMSSMEIEFDFRNKLSDDVSLIAITHRVTQEDKIRAGGFAPPNIAANVLSMLIFVNIYNMYRSGWLGRVLLTFSSILLMYGLLQTGSKAGLIGIVIGLFFFIVIIPELRDKIIRLSAVGAVMMVLFLTVAGGMVLRRLEASVTGEADFLADRIGWWSSGYQALQEYGGIGTGAGGMSPVVLPAPGTHSFPFSILFEFGYAIFFVFLVLAAVIALRIIRKRPLSHQLDLRIMMYCLIGAFFTLFLHGLVNFDYDYTVFWVLAALLLALVKVAEKER